MRSESVNKNHSAYFLLIILGLTLLIVTCTRDEDSEAVRRESLTRKLTEDINADSLESYVAWMEGMGTRFALADNHRDVAMAILMKFKTLGYSNTRLDSFLLDRTYDNIRYLQWQYNVIATLDGTCVP